MKNFKTEFHFDPVAQYQSGMCWCFCGTSFLESEVYRLSGKKVKLSELHTVYYEYIEKARGYIKERGYSELGEGSEVNAVFRIMKEYGAVPAEAYTGLLKEEGRHDHSDMFEAIENYLHYLNDINQWDEEIALQSIRAILNKYIGEPPQSFEYDGNAYTPKTFFTDYLQLNLDDYIDVMSTSKIDFYTKGEFEVPDNWWHDSSYYNIPLEEWYQYIKAAISQGYTIAIGGDVSEPGYYGFEDAAFVPDFDIPQAYINQDSREYRIYNGSTEDDHGIHLVGYTQVDDYDWYLIKDSGRGSRHGKLYGYYMYREDYIKLKMLSYTVHKDILKDIIGKFK